MRGTMPAQAAPRLCRVAGRDTWHIYFQRRRISTHCTDRTEAERELARFIAAPPDTAPLAIAAILERYLANRADRKIPGLERLRFAHKPLVRFLGPKPPEAITDALCRRYARQRAAEGVGEATARTELQALRAALRWAAGRGKLIATAPEVELPPRPPARDRWLTRAEADRLVGACRRPHLRLFVLLALHTAARAGAVLALTWDRVDLERRRIDYREPGRPATRKGRAIVPINETLLPALIEAHRVAATSFVIEWAGGSVASVKHGFHSAALAAALPDASPHTLRHTAATWMAQRAVPIWQIAGFMGHSNPRMVEQTYGHHHPDFMAEAARALQQ